MHINVHEELWSHFLYTAKSIKTIVYIHHLLYSNYSIFRFKIRKKKKINMRGRLEYFPYKRSRFVKKMNMRGMGCALSVHKKECRKSLKCALYIDARYLPENTVVYFLLYMCWACAIKITSKSPLHKQCNIS
jgi:hypothetical protein